MGNKAAGDSVAQSLALREQAKASFRHPVELIEPQTQADAMAMLGEMLTPMFLFLGRGRLGGTMDIRSWVLLYLTRSDLIQGETIEAFAKRRGIDPKRVRVLMKEFLAMVPGYRSPHAKSPAQVAAMRAAQRARQKMPIRDAEASPAPPPLGKESFSAPASSAGSADR